jgi:hypothetical protein
MRWIGSRRGGTGCRASVVALLLLLALLSGPPGATATPTAPSLLLTGAETELGEGGAMVRVRGTFPYEDLIHQPYPLQLFIREIGSGNRFVCFSVPWGVMAGEDAIFANGLDEALVAEISNRATPSPDGEIAQLGPRHIIVHMPAGFPAGPVEAQIFVMYEGAPVFSNPLRFAIEGDE